MNDTLSSPYKDVRSLVRGLKLIETLIDTGWSKIGALSTAAGIERASTYRLINTLMQLGYVTRREEDGAVALTPKFAHLADAFKEDDIVTQFAWPYLYELTRDILWPCDFASFSAGKVLIKLTTHKISPMSIHRGMVGKERHLVRSALGMAILAAMTDDELDAALMVVAKLGGSDAEDIKDREHLQGKIVRIRQQGYASSTGQMEERISAIALPVLTSQRRVLGAVNVVFFRSTMTTAEAADRYLDKLRQCAKQVGQAMDDFVERKGAA